MRVSMGTDATDGRKASFVPPAAAAAAASVKAPLDRRREGRADGGTDKRTNSNGNFQT